MPEPRIIAIETSGRSGSVAIAEGSRLLEEAEFAADQEHARDLLPLIDSLIRRRDWTPQSIDQCYVSIGPGSFTGLRVSVTFVRHLALATHTKICAVPTLDVVAMNALDLSPAPDSLAVVLDAKQGKVFAAVFRLEGDSYRCESGPVMIEPGILISKCEPGIPIIGEGVPYHEAAFRKTGATILDATLNRPRAAAVHRLGWKMASEGRFITESELVPLYVRRPEAEDLWEKRRAAQSNET